MNTRLVKLLIDRGGAIGTCGYVGLLQPVGAERYSHHETTRIDHCNHYWVVEKVKYERGNDDSSKREEA